MLIKTQQDLRPLDATVTGHEPLQQPLDGSLPPSRAPYRRPVKTRINFDVSPKLMREIRQRAIGQGLTVRAYMLKLLAAEGLDTLDPELLDGRTLRAAGITIPKTI